MEDHMVAAQHQLLQQVIFVILNTQVAVLFVSFIQGTPEHSHQLV
jgi:hypothetical protein